MDDYADEIVESYFAIERFDRRDSGKYLHPVMVDGGFSGVVFSLDYCQPGCTINAATAWYGQINKINQELSVPTFFFIDEPETFLHPQAQDKLLDSLENISQNSQVFITTHSYDILSNEGIAPEEVLLLTNSPEGTEVEVLSNVEKAKNILAAGFSMADVVMPLTKPWSIESMSHIKLD